MRWEMQFQRDYLILYFLHIYLYIFIFFFFLTHRTVFSLQRFCSGHSTAQSNPRLSPGSAEGTGALGGDWPVAAERCAEAREATGGALGWGRVSP